MKQRGTRAKAGRGAPKRSGRSEVRVRMTVACTRKNCKNGPILLAARSVTLVARRRKSCSQIGTQILNVGLTSHLCCQNPSVSADHERACRASLSKSGRLWLVEGEIGFGQWRACACQNPTQQRTGHLRRSNLQLGESGQGLRLAARSPTRRSQAPRTSQPQVGYRSREACHSLTGLLLPRSTRSIPPNS
jgi:hypothetical protein